MKNDEKKTYLWPKRHQVSWAFSAGGGDMAAAVGVVIGWQLFENGGGGAIVLVNSC